MTKRKQTWAEEMRGWRAKLGLSQEEMGWLLGMRQQHYNRLETGVRAPTRIIMHNVAALRTIIDLGGYGKYKDRILDLPFESKEYHKFWEDNARVTRLSRFSRYRVIENPFTGEKVRVEG